MRAETDKAKLESFMTALGQRVRGEGRIYLTGGATAVLHGWRPMTIDLKPDPEPPMLDVGWWMLGTAKYAKHAKWNS
jgi:hypothetical protein